MNLSKPIFFSKYFLLAISFFPITLSLNAQTCTAANATAFEACAAGSDPIINVTATYTVNNSVDLSGKTIDINNNEDITFTSSVTVNTGTSFSGGGNASVTTTVPDPGITAGTGSSDVTIAELNDAIASGETTLENAMLSAAGLLPVELMYFRALKRNNNVDLQWATALELDNSYFEILSGPSPESLSSITRIQGAGNSSSAIKYAFTDEDPADGKRYYQLKQVDYNGKFSLSEIRSVDIKDERGVTLINPVGAPFIIVKTERNIQKITIFNVAGAIMQEQNVTGNYDELRIDISHLNSSNYFLRVTDTNGQTITKQFVKS